MLIKSLVISGSPDKGKLIIKHYFFICCHDALFNRIYSFTHSESFLCLLGGSVEYTWYMPYFFFYFSNSHVYKCHSWLQYTVNKLIQELNLSKFFSCEQTEVLANCSTAPFNREHSEKLRAGDAPYHRKRSSSEQHCWRQGQLFTWSSSVEPAGWPLKVFFHITSLQKNHKIRRNMHVTQKRNFSYFCSAGNQTQGLLHTPPLSILLALSNNSNLNLIL